MSTEPRASPVARSEGPSVGLVKLDGALVPVVLALIAGLSQFIAMPAFFFIRDFRSLHWARVGWRLIRHDMTAFVGTWPDFERPVALVKLHFFVALKLAGSWWPGHALLATLPHVACTVAVFFLARRLARGVHVAVAPVVALLFAVAPGSAVLTWASTVHHLYATLAALLLALAYLRYAETGTPRTFVEVLAAAGFVYVANESAVVVLFVPLVLEAARGGMTGTRRTRWVLVGVCGVAACLRFFTVFGWSSLMERLRGDVSVYPESPVYTADLAPGSLAIDVARCFEVGLGIPLVAVIPVLLFSLWFVRDRRAGAAVRFGLLFAVLMALPLASLKPEPRPWDGYECIAGLLIAVVTSLFTLVVPEGRSSSLRVRIVAAVVFVLAASAAIVKYRSARLFYGDIPAQMRALYEGLDARLPRGRIGTVVLYGVPAQTNRSNYPSMMDRFWPGLMHGRRPVQIVMVTPHAAEEIDWQRVVWVHSIDSPLVRLVEPVYRFRLMGGGERVPDHDIPPPTDTPRTLVPCSGDDCLDPQR